MEFEKIMKELLDLIAMNITSKNKHVPEIAKDQSCKGV
jgi:hypothetical protein